MTKPDQQAIIKRRDIEHRIVTKAIRSLLQHGYSLTVRQNDLTPLFDPCADEEKILSHVFQNEIAHLLVWQGEAFVGYVLLVFNREGHDVIADRSPTLDSELAEALALAEQIASEESGVALSGASARDLLSKWLHVAGSSAPATLVEESARALTQPPRVVLLIRGGNLQAAYSDQADLMAVVIDHDHTDAGAELTQELEKAIHGLSEIPLK